MPTNHYPLSYISYFCHLECSLFGPTRLSILRLCLMPMAVRSVGTIKNTHNLWRSDKDPSMFPLDMVETAFKQWKMKENHNIRSELSQKIYNENIWNVDITKAIIFRFFIHFTSVVVILVKFYCFTSLFVLKLEVKSVVPELTTSDSEQRWMSLLKANMPSKWGSCF